LTFQLISCWGFFTLLEQIKEKKHFSPTRVDETWLSTAKGKQSKIVALRGKKQVGALTSAERQRDRPVVRHWSLTFACLQQASLSYH
jgi:hypothetical protein